MSRDEPRLTATTLRVLGALMSSPREQLSGADIARVTKLPSGTLYPILFRLEGAKWVESDWEAGDPRLLGRPRRRYYRITPLGEKNVSGAVGELRIAFGRLAWS
jgi:PadR family transcriptional regulator